MKLLFRIVSFLDALVMNIVKGFFLDIRVDFKYFNRMTEIVKKSAAHFET